MGGVGPGHGMIPPLTVPRGLATVGLLYAAGGVILRACGVILGVALLVSVGLGGRAAAVGTDEHRVLEGGWFEQPPYAHMDRNGRLTGFDIVLLREVGNRAGISFAFRQIDWARTQAFIRDGQLDFGMVAFRTPERERWARFSAPYRREVDDLFLAPSLTLRVDPGTPEGLFAEIRRRGLRIGFVEGFDYGPLATTFLADPANQSRIMAARTDAENATRLGEGKIDGFLADRLSGYHALADTDALARPSPITVFQDDVHVMFSRATVSSALVERFDRALAAIIADGTYEKIKKSFTVPAMLDIATSTVWFKALDWVGTVAYAISGVLIARREAYSLFGAFVLALLPALGGNVVGDLMVGRHPIGMLETPVGVLLVLATVVIGYGLFQLYDFVHGRFLFMLDIAWYFMWTRRYLPPQNVYEFFDAMALAAFTVGGVVVAIRFGATPLWIWGPMLAVLAAAGGSIMRDVIRSDADNPGLKSTLYAEIALVWGLLLSLVATTSDVVAGPGRFQFAVIVVVIGAFLSRMTVVILRVRSPRF